VAEDRVYYVVLALNPTAAEERIEPLPQTNP
jgi:hypothetical protein